MNAGAEIWQPVSGYDYLVSNTGQVYSLKTERFLKPHQNNYGYLLVILSHHGKTKGFSVHRLVAQAFIPNPESLPEINHKDGNKQNNNVDNLEWVTGKQNRLHAYLTGLTSKFDTPVVQLTIGGHLVQRFETLYMAAKATGLNVGNIYHSYKGNYYKTGNFRFVFEKFYHPVNQLSLF